MKYCAAPRQELGIRTLLNVLGPLTNPAGATHQVLGVYDARLTEVMAKVLVQLGSQHCFVLHGMDGLDELTICDRTKVSEGRAGVVSNYFVAPEEFDLPRVHKKEIAGGTPDVNARIAKEILQGKKGPRRDIVCLNAAAAIVAGQLAKTLKDGLRVAQHALDSGAAAEKLDRLVAWTQKVM
jgi:anthranilate phosphoribosyltransferase